MVVTKLKRDCGRPDRLRESVERLGVRKKERDGDAGRGDSDLCGGARSSPSLSEGFSWTETVGRNSGLVEFVFWSLVRERCFLSLGIWLADASPEDGDRGDETKDDRTDESWTMGGKAGLRCDWEVGDPRGECEGEDRELWTYGCLGS